MNRLILAAALATACTGSKNYWNPYTPIKAQTSLSKEAAIQKAVIAITDAGKEIESSDASTGIVISKWFGSPDFGANDTRFRVRVTYADSAYEIVALCQSKATGDWKDEGCEPAKRPQFVLDVVAKVDTALKASSAAAPPAPPASPAPPDAAAPQ